jgi:hypothetical protein
MHCGISAATLTSIVTSGADPSSPVETGINGELQEDSWFGKPVLEWPCWVCQSQDLCIASQRANHITMTTDEAREAK